MLEKHFKHNVHFLNYFTNVYKTFAVKPQFLELFYKCLINVFSKNICTENVLRMFFKHCNVNVYLETFNNPKDRV